MLQHWIWLFPPSNVRDFLKCLCHIDDNWNSNNRDLWDTDWVQAARRKDLFLLANRHQKFFFSESKKNTSMITASNCILCAWSMSPCRKLYLWYPALNLSQDRIYKKRRKKICLWLLRFRPRRSYLSIWKAAKISERLHRCWNGVFRCIVHFGIN